MSSGLLSGLGGIEKPRDVQVRVETPLEQLVKASEEVLNGDIIELSKIVSREVIDRLDYVMSKFEGNDPLSQLYKTLPTQLSNVQFTEKDIESFVFSNMDKDSSEQERVAIGFFTGALAHILTERNRKQGTPTRIYINGQGKRFDYLFHHARNVDEIIVQNLTGYDICGSIENANRLIGVSLKGDNIFNGYSTGEGNKIREIIGIGINGDNNFNSLNNFEQLIAIGMLGNQTLNESKSSCLKRVVAVNVNNIDLKHSSPIDNSSCDIMLFGAPYYSLPSGYLNADIKSQNVFAYQNIPFPVGAKLYQIIYNGSAEEYTQHKDSLDADKLSAHLKDKPQDEIVRIVDEITRYGDQLSQQLSMR